MKKAKYLILFLSIVTLSSCLRHGLEELPLFEDNDITSVPRVEYRFVGDRTSPASGQPLVEAITLNQSPAAVIDKDAKTVKISLVVPGTTNVFTEKYRNECSVNNIVVSVGISTAARISPVGGAPKLGMPGDWSKPNKYVVVAANGDKKEWTIEVVSFTK